MPKSLRILLDMVWVILLSPILIDGVIRKLTRQWARKQTQLRRVELAMITLDMKMGGNGKLNSIPQVAQEFLTRLVLFLVILIPTTPSIFWETVMNGLLLVRDFL